MRIRCVDAFKIFNLNTIGARGWKLGTAGFSNLGTSTRLGYVDTQEKSSLRIGRLLDAFGWSSSDRQISTGDLDVKAGQSVTDKLAECIKRSRRSRTRSVLYGADGKATFRDRNYKRTQQFTSQATFGNGVGELPFSDVITTLDDSKILNIISVTRDGGTEQIVQDTDSIAKFGARQDSLSGTLNVSDADALQLQNRDLHSFQILV